MELAKRHRIVTASKSSGTTDYRIDASRAAELEMAVRGCRPELVVNAVKPPLSTDGMEKYREAAYALNAALPERLAALGKKYGFTLVQISTDWVYPGERGEIYSEQSLTYPKNYYAHTKMLGEERAWHISGGKCLVLRTEGVFGYDNRGSNIFLRLKNAKKAGKPVFAASDQYSQPIYGGELARLASRLLEKGKTGIFNAVGRDYLSRLEFVRAACRRFAFEARVAPYSAVSRGLRIPQYLKVDVRKVERIAGRIRPLGRQFDELEHEWLEWES